MTEFIVGQQIVCIGEHFRGPQRDGAPYFGGLYTIRSVHPFLLETTCVTLEEAVADDGERYAFASEWFRPRTSDDVAAPKPPRAPKPSPEEAVLAAHKAARMIAEVILEQGARDVTMQVGDGPVEHFDDIKKRVSIQ